MCLVKPDIFGSIAFHIGCWASKLQTQRQNYCQISSKLQLLRQRLMPDALCIGCWASELQILSQWLSPDCLPYWMLSIETTNTVTETFARSHQCVTLCRQLRFPESCLGAIFTLVGAVLLSPHPHIGCRLQVASVTFFVASIVPVYAGLVVSCSSLAFIFLLKSPW